MRRWDWGSRATKKMPVAMGATRIMPSCKVQSVAHRAQRETVLELGVKAVEKEGSNRRYVSRAPVVNGRKPFAAREI